MARHNVIGSSGEKFAVDFLRQKNYSLITTNFRSKLGEVDIIAKERTQFVFVEVKTRSGTLFGTPAQAITPKKLKSLIKTAEYYLLVNNLARNYRIDAIEVVLFGQSVKSINHIKNITL